MLVDALGAAEPADAGGLLWDFAAGLAVPTFLATIGMPESDLDRAVGMAVDMFDQAPQGNPRPYDSGAVADLVRAAWSGRRPDPVAAEAAQ